MSMLNVLDAPSMSLTGDDGVPVTVGGVVSGIAAVVKLYSTLSFELSLASVLFTTK